MNICFILNTLQNDQVNRKAISHLAIELINCYCNVGRPNATKTVHNVHVNLYTLTFRTWHSKIFVRLSQITAT